MKTILELIDVVEKSISEYNIKEIIDTVSLLVEEIFQVLPQIEEQYIMNINKILKNTNAALGNKDYLLYHDILENDLKPIIEILI